MWMCCEAPTLSPGFGYVPAAGCNTLGIKWGMLEAKFDTSFSLSLTHNTCTIKGFRGNVLPNVSIHFSCFHRSLARNIQFVKSKRHDMPCHIHLQFDVNFLIYRSDLKSI